MSRDKKEPVATKDGAESSRRDFLRTAGKTAVYTPPVMLAVSQPNFAHAQSSGGQSSPTIEDLQAQYGDDFDTLWQQFLDWLANNS